MPWLPSVHDEADTLWWMRQIVLGEQRVMVAQDGGTISGFAALNGHWLEQLYVEPEAQGTGVGRALFAAVKEARPGGFSLRVFSRNTRARLFYEAVGCTLTARSDGSRNEENEPDCTYWSGSVELPRNMRDHPDADIHRDAGI